MKLREAYIETETERIECQTKEAIRKLQIIPGVESPEYESKYEAIMDNYRLRLAAIESLKIPK